MTTTANLDSFKIREEVASLISSAGAINEQLFAVVSTMIGEYCDASRDMIRLSLRIEGEVVEINDKVNRNLGIYCCDNIARYAAELAAATAVRTSSARNITGLLSSICATPDVLNAASNLIFGTPQF